MKVQLVVVQGKPEGALIPIAIPKFKIGRGEGCQLRPSSDQISREHAEFEVTADSVILRDLGSRNGTEVNGKKLEPKVDCVLKAGDLIKVGLLTFAISIEGGPAVKTTIAPPGGSNRNLKSLDDAAGDDIDSWLVADNAHTVPDRPSGVYGGDTMTMDTYKEKSKPTSSASIPTKPASSASIPTKPASSASVPARPPSAASIPTKPPVEEEVEEEENSEGRFIEDEQVEDDMGFEDLAALQAAEAGTEAEAEAEEEFVDESNPFYVAKKKAAAPAEAEKAKDPNKDSSDLAHDILRKMMERRRASKS